MQLAVPTHTPAVTEEADILHTVGMHFRGQQESTLNLQPELERVFRSLQCLTLRPVGSCQLGWLWVKNRSCLFQEPSFWLCEEANCFEKYQEILVTVSGSWRQALICQVRMNFCSVYLNSNVLFKREVGGWDRVGRVEWPSFSWLWFLSWDLSFLFNNWI